MENFKISERSLSGIRGAVTRSMNSAKEAANVDIPILMTVKSNVEITQQRWKKYLDSYENFIAERDEIDEEDYEAFVDFHGDYEVNYNRDLNKLLDLLGKLSLQENKGLAPVQMQRNLAVRLPEVKLNKFEGRLEEWQCWWDSYRSLVHDRKDLDKVVKMTHLKSCISGKAHAVIAGFQITESDYDDAISALIDRFANPERVKQSLVMQLVNMNRPSHNVKELEQFKLEFERILKSLGHHVDDLEASHWLISILLQNKLPSEAEMFIFQKYQHKYFTIEEISQGLADHLEFLDKTPNSSKLPTDRVKQDSDKAQFRSKGNFSNQIKNESVDKTQIGAYAVESTIKVKCYLCDDTHKARLCSKYDNANARRNRLVEVGKCFRCLKSRHEGRCQEVVRCFTCNKNNHNELFCYRNLRDNSRSNNQVGSSTQPSSSVNTVNVEVGSLVSSAKCMGSKYSSMLATAQVSVSNNYHSQPEFVRCFWDPGSQLSFISSKLARKLNLKAVDSQELVLQGFGSQPREGNFEFVAPLVSLGRRIKRVMTVVVDQIPKSISAPGLANVYKLLEDNGIKTADRVSSDTISNIELMIGADYFAEFIRGMDEYEGIRLFDTAGGYIPFGKVPREISNEVNTCVSANYLVCRLTVNVSPLQVREIIEEDNKKMKEVHKLWDLESLGICPTAQAVEDDKAYRDYVRSVQYIDGKYFVRLPWKENHALLPNNYRNALGQVHSLRKNLSRIPGRLEAYDRIIRDQYQAKFIEKVPNAVARNDTHYIPHHGVTKDSDSTPLRIVYNCSFKAEKDSPSLNDVLLKGPGLTEKLGDVLLKFRIYEFAFCADISKAFLRVGLQSVDRDFVRFLWFKDPQHPEVGLDTYRFASVLFGSTSSPFLLMATLDYHLSRSNSPFKDFIANNLYVDNLQGSLSKEEELLEFYEEANTELESANMPLRKWVSNNRKLRDRIQEDNSDYVVPDITSVLGLIWNVNLDTIALKTANMFVPEVITKRNLLSLVSSVFDPLGLLSPIVIRGKILIQAAWRTNVSWNEPLGEEFVNNWAEICREFQAINQFSVPRMVATQGVNYKLHVFCDSSLQAYGCAAYLVGNGQANLVMAKAKVAPLKTKTLPQLELTSIWLGTRLAKYIHEVLGEIEISRTVIWADNEAAIQWVRNDNSKITYVKNRVAEIREIAGNYAIFHVATSENPADLVTRGIEVKELIDSSWFKGPTWLTDEDSWPCQKDEVVVYGITAERQVMPVKVESLFRVEDHSSLEKVFTITKCVFQFLRNLLQRKFPGRVMKRILPAPANFWLRYYQLTKYRETFTWLFYTEDRDLSEYQFLYDLLPKPNGLSLECAEFIKDLGLYFDPSVGLIRSRGRLQHAEIETSSKYPVLIPPGEHITKLLIVKAHRYSLHGGVQETLAMIRRQFWIPKGRQAVRKVVRSCTTCKRIEGRTCVYPGPPSLPLHRVILNRPFENVGVDYSGPIIITKTEDNQPRKVYICLITCTATRAVHLDVALDMTAESFLLIFRRFCGTWSVPKQVISDNGCNFKATAKFLEEISEDENVREHFSKNYILWKFIAPRAPWMGGFYERLIKVVKNCLRKILYRKRISLQELQTVVVEMQSRINNRPLTYIDSDRMPLEPLSPSHLLYGRAIEAMPPVIVEEESDPTYIDHNHLNKQFSLLSSMISKFERVWKNEYLLSLRERHYGAQRAKELNNLKVGDVVLIQVESPRSEWPLGRIVELRPDSEGVVRSVDVFCRGHISTKTVEKIVNLEVSESVDEETLNVIDDKDKDKNDNPSSTMPPIDQGLETRPQRASKIRATRERRELINQGAL